MINYGNYCLKNTLDVNLKEIYEDNSERQKASDFLNGLKYVSISLKNKIFKIKTKEDIVKITAKVSFSYDSS